MRKYLQKMNELGLTTATVSKTLQKAIKEFEEGVEEYNGLVEQLEVDSENEQLQAQVQEYADLLEETDNELVAKVIKYESNKEHYQQKMAAMRGKQGQNKAATTPPAPTPTPIQGSGTVSNVTTTVSTPANNANIATNPTPTPSGNPPVVVLPKEEKEDGFGSLLLWAGLGALGLIVGINVWKNRQ